MGALKLAGGARSASASLRGVGRSVGKYVVRRPRLLCRALAVARGTCLSTHALTYSHTHLAACLRVRPREVRLSSMAPEHGEMEGEIASRSVVRKFHAKGGERVRSPRTHYLG